MALNYSSYFGLARVSDMGPEIKAWSATDINPEVISLVLKSLTLHHHGAATPMRYPGYNAATPATPLSPTAVEHTGSTGVLSPGSVIGVRMSYLDNLGLETESSPEIRTILSAIPERPGAPDVGVPISTPVPNAVGGGTYVYVMTKGKGTGETQVSGVGQVDVPYDSTGALSYVIPLTFANFGSFTDGTDNLKLYRSRGLTSDFQLVKTFSDMNVASYNDNGALEDATVLPPRTNTFDKNKYLSVSWASFTHPTTAVAMNVYVTQNPGVYGVNHLLLTVDLTTPYQTQTNYLGSETLRQTWPKEFTQLPGSPPKVILNTEATGAPVLTEYMNFAGYEALNFVLPWNNAHSTPIRGNMYYDYSSDSVKIRLASGYVTLATPTGSFIHSTTEPGGHVSANILFGNTNQFNMGQLTGILANTTGTQFRKQVTSILLATPSSRNFLTTSSSAAPLPEMETGFASGVFTPDFGGQMVEITLTGGFLLDPKTTRAATATFQLEFNGSMALGTETVRSFTAAATPSHLPLQISYATPISNTLKVRAYWQTTTSSELTSIGPRRQLMIKELF